MKNPRATKILRWATAIGALPLIVGVPFAIAWVARPTEWLNTTFGLPYAGAALLLFTVACILGLVATILSRRVTKDLLVLGGVQTCSVSLGMWLILVGPGQSISVSEVIIVNDSSETLAFVEIKCPYYSTSLRGIGSGEKRAVPVMPKCEGALEIRVKMTDEGFLTYNVFIQECAAEEFVFNISENGISSNRIELPLKDINQGATPSADKRRR